MYHIVVICISFIAAFFSGLLGIGGGIITFPAFLYLVPFLGYSSFSVNEITGIAAAQSFAGIFFAFLHHKKIGNIDKTLVKAALPAGIAGGFIGAISAKFILEKDLLIIYLVLLAIAAILILIPQAEYFYERKRCAFNRPVLANFLIFCGTAISGAMGFAGSATFIPILNHFCKAPIKVAISTTIFIVLITTAVIFTGKASIGLIPYNLIIYIIIGAFLGAAVGTKINKMLPPWILRIIFLLVIVILGIKIFFTLLEY